MFLLFGTLPAYTLFILLCVNAAENIKNVILQGQYEAAKGVNRIQLATYFSVGKYVSSNTRQGVWGTGALEVISSRLRQLLPGLRGYSADSLKLMCIFYEEWKELDATSLETEGKKKKSLITIHDLDNAESSQLSIRELQFTNSADFPIDDFFKVPFTHHSRILAKVKSLDERLYYIHRCAEEHMSVETLKKVMVNDDFHHQSDIPNNFRDLLPVHLFMDIETDCCIIIQISFLAIVLPHLC